MDEEKIVIDLLDQNPLPTASNIKKSDQGEETIEQRGVEEGLIESIKESVKAEEDRPMEEIAEEEGKHDAVKEIAKDAQKHKDKFEGLVDRSAQILLSIKNIIPLLPSEVIIDVHKISMIHRPFFFSERVHSASIRDIMDVYIDTMPFLASLNIVDAGFADNVVQVKWLKKAEAEKARRIITGLMEASKEGIDLRLLTEEELNKKLEELGKVRETSKTSVSTHEQL